MLKTRYFYLIQEKQKGTIRQEDFEVTFNKISDALYAFFDSVLDEVRRLPTLENQGLEEGKDQQETINLVVVLNGNYEGFTKKNAEFILDQIRRKLNLEPKELVYFSKRKGSILIDFTSRRSYSRLIKLKSLAKIQVLPNLIAIQAEDEWLNTFCDAFVELQINLEFADLSKPKFSWISLFKSILYEFDLSTPDLSGTDLSDANFFGANLSEVNLSGANLSRANLLSAKLEETNLSYADLSGAKLNDAHLSSTRMWGVNLSGAILSGADLSGANLSRVDLSRANLTKANLFCADLSRANLSWANLSEADLSEVNLYDVNLYKTIFHQKQVPYLQIMNIDISQCIFVDDSETTKATEVTIPSS